MLDQNDHLLRILKEFSLTTANKCSQQSLMIVKVYILQEISEDTNPNILRAEKSSRTHTHTLSLLELLSALSLFPLSEIL